MADRYFVSENGVLREMTEQEKMERITEIQKQKLEGLQIDVITREELLQTMIDSFSVTTPDGSTAKACELENTVINLPLKLGQKWERIIDFNSKSVSYQLVPNPEAIGTSAENPIVYYDGVPLIDNAFYQKDGVVQVYMNGQWAEW